MLHQAPIAPMMMLGISALSANQNLRAGTLFFSLVAVVRYPLECSRNALDSFR